MYFVSIILFFSISTIIFTLPWIIGFLLTFGVTLYLKIYSIFKEGDYREESYWKDVKTQLSKFWLLFARIWHSYEVIGIENIPENPCLFVGFHAALPIDMFFFVYYMYENFNISIKSVSDNFFTKFKFYDYYSYCFGTGCFDINSCIKILKKNHLIILPGGAYEGHISQNYKLEWKSRLGFVKVAKESNVDIIPIFTLNIQEGYRTIGICMNFWKNFYEKTRLPIVPMYGGFPVKLKTIIGKPIKFDENITEEELKKQVMDNIYCIIKENQKIPGNILSSILDRI